MIRVNVVSTNAGLVLAAIMLLAPNDRAVAMPERDTLEPRQRARRNDTSIVCTTTTTVEDRGGTIIINDREECRPMGGLRM